MNKELVKEYIDAQPIKAVTKLDLARENWSMTKSFNVRRGRTQSRKSYVGRFF